MSIDPGWPVAVALAALLALALGAHRFAGYGLTGTAALAAARALVQLSVVALLIKVVVDSVALSALFSLAMFGMGVFTTSRRTGARRSWPWAAAAMACGVVPVLAIVLASRAVPFEGIAIIPVAGIVIGNAMTANTLVGRHAYAVLADEHAQYEASLALGMSPAQGILEIIHRRSPEALLPGLDQVSTTGLVTLPGAFIGVMLGGGSPVQAATAQVLVLFGIMAAQTITVLVAERLIAARRLLPAALRASLRD
ncbi:ABC transporter permease [Nocardioides marmoriginsengisoli]|uniref:ABC transporter permease n=1 Tax=Nocardioides marmoriginsengisoli TaxID=661483 RepID=A0A3N0CEV6_9ACTN|nr:ABC transporter permease [Nocardioides marmoriginsengisoli]RNL61994.1 ABC transporter permease [Nocardioides marmoriginsengisoli]